LACNRGTSRGKSQKKDGDLSSNEEKGLASTARKVETAAKKTVAGLCVGEGEKKGENDEGKNAGKKEVTRPLSPWFRKGDRLRRETKDGGGVKL